MMPSVKWNRNFIKAAKLVSTIHCPPSHLTWQPSFEMLLENKLQQADRQVCRAGGRGVHHLHELIVQHSLRGGAGSFEKLL